MMVKYYFLCYIDMHYFVIQWIRSFLYLADHELNNYRDTKAECRHLKKFIRIFLVELYPEQLFLSTVILCIPNWYAVSVLYATVYCTDS